MRESSDEDGFEDEMRQEGDEGGMPEGQGGQTEPGVRLGREGQIE